VQRQVGGQPEVGAVTHIRDIRRPPWRKLPGEDGAGHRVGGAAERLPQLPPVVAILVPAVRGVRRGAEQDDGCEGRVVEAMGVAVTLVARVASSSWPVVAGWL